MQKIILYIAITTLIEATTYSCSNTSLNTPNPVPTTTAVKKATISKEFQEYWYGGKAEITSYELKQARYGEIRSGKAVLIYVTEDFLAQEQVKADTYHTTNIPVLKLNATKKFNTGIYPYSIMQSTFYPVSNEQHAVKVSSSMQEWCGHVYAQLNNRKQFDILSHSYFQGEGDQQFSIDKTWLENEIWTKIRIAPDQLPTGSLKMIPSFEYCRLKHREIKAYQANSTLEKNNEISTYTIDYPDLRRVITITFSSTFPYTIESWTETFTDGYGAGAKKLQTTGTKLKRIQSAYWSKNSTQNEVLRDTLLLNH